MKKILLSLVALIATTASFAQSKTLAAFTVAKKVGEYKSMQAPVKHEATNAYIQKANHQSRRAQAEGVFYARPEGTYWLGGTTEGGETFKYLVVPPFTDLTFINASNDVTTGTWTIGTNKTDLSNYVKDNNLVFSFSKQSPGYLSFAPTLTDGSVEYEIADGVLTVDSVPQVLYPFNYVDAKRYYGYQGGGSAFMSGADSFDFDGDGTADVFYPEFRQYFEKPATPLALSEVILWATSANKDFNGSTLSLVFNKVERDEQNRRIIGEEIATMKLVNCEMESEVISAESPVYPGTLTFANTVIDEFGTEESAPLVLDEAFAITIKGTREPGVDVRFYFCDQGEAPEEWWTRATPTYIVPFDASGNSMIREDGNPNGLSYFNNTEKSGPYCYSIAFIFYGEMDGIEVVTSDDLNKQISPVEGGETASPIVEGETQGYPAYVYTNYPMFDEEGDPTGNYTFSGVPEWAQLLINPTGYEYHIGQEDEIRGLHMIWFNCDALPAGETGRTATIYIESQFGLKSANPIYIVQGDAEIVDGVNAIKFDADGKFVGSTFNIAGQRIAEGYKGLVIKNGKKYVVK